LKRHANLAVEPLAPPPGCRGANINSKNAVPEAGWINIDLSLVIFVITLVL